MRGLLAKQAVEHSSVGWCQHACSVDPKKLGRRFISFEKRTQTIGGARVLHEADGAGLMTPSSSTTPISSPARPTT
jgi:hypothetical protein